MIGNVLYEEGRTQIDFSGGIADKESVMNFVNFNGELVDRSQATVKMASEGVQLGMGVFETMLAVNGVVDGIELHLLRLQKGIDQLGYRMVLQDSLADVVTEVIDANELRESRAKVRVTTMDGVCLVEASPAPERSESCAVIVSEYACNERSATVGLKCSSYANNLLAFKAGQAVGADEVIMLNTKEEVAEASMANLFIVKNGVLLTPSLDSGCLPGVTRELVMRRAETAGIEVREEALLIDDVHNADEVFLTNTLSGVRAVWKIGEEEVEKNGSSTGGVGVMTAKVKEIYNNDSNGDQ